MFILQKKSKSAFLKNLEGSELMPDGIEILKLRILVCFLEMSLESCTVTNLAKTLAEEKYAISRAMISLEKEGLLDRSKPRHPKLTPSGEIAAKRYAERMDIAIKHLIYEGVDAEEAQKDARFFSLYCSDKTFEVFRSMEERYRIKHVLRNRKNFDGAVLCHSLRDGNYSLPFIIYREHVKNNSNISMANEGFEHPCELVVKRGKGIIRLRAIPVTYPSATDGKKRSAQISSLKYADGESFNDAERNGDFWQFPAEVLRFINVGSDVGRVLHGSVFLKMTSSVGQMYMPESAAIFTILL